MFNKEISIKQTYWIGYVGILNLQIMYSKQNKH